LAKPHPGYEYLEGKLDKTTKKGELEKIIMQGLRSLGETSVIYARKASE
jgi:hypothetical protein